MKVSFHEQKKVKLLRRKELKSFIPTIFTNENKQVQSLTVIFCSDEYLLQINKDHLQHDYYTDIITFDLSENQTSIIGELYISIDRVKDNAKLHKQEYTRELHRVIFHGILHLCGYKDKSKKEVSTIRSKEDFYLAKYI